MRLFRFFNVTKSRRPRQADVRRVARSRQPLMEEVESRTLLSATAIMYIDNPVIKDVPGQNAPANFTVRLTNPSNQVVFAQYHTVDHTATAGKDYAEKTGYVVFSPGQTTQLITCTALGGGEPGTVRAFGVQLSNVYNASLMNTEGIGSISYVDTSAPPALSIGDVSMHRGLDGSKTMVFDVSLNAVQSSPVSVTATTYNLSAIAGVDYQAKSQVLTFQPGQKTAEFTVTVYGSHDYSTKIFLVNLSGTSADLAKGFAGGILSYGA